MHLKTYAYIQRLRLGGGGAISDFAGASGFLGPRNYKI